MELRNKVGLATIMGLGLIAVVAATVKTVELKNLATRDFTYNATDLVYWYITENWVIIIAACIPTLGPLYLVALGKASKESLRRGDASRGSNSWFNRWKLRSWFSKSSSAYSSASKIHRDGYLVQQEKLGHSGQTVELVAQPSQGSHRSQDPGMRKTTEFSMV